MKWFLALSGAFLVGILLLAGASSNSQSSSTSSSQSIGEMVGHVEHLFAGWARWESDTQYQITSQSPEAAQAALGFLMCLRSLLVMAGFFALRMLRKMVNRVSR